MEHDMVREFRKELAQIRDRINFLFDRLESAENEADKYKTGKQLTTGSVAPLETGNGLNKSVFDLFTLDLPIALHLIVI